MTSEPTVPFQAARTVVDLGDGRWSAHIDPTWNLRPLPHGGLVTAVAMSALAAQVTDPDQTLRSLHTTFVGQVTDGPVEIATEVLRQGRSMSHLRAEVRNPGAKAGHVTTAVFGRGRDGFSFVDLEPPRDVPAPLDCPSFRDPPPPGAALFPPLPFWREVVEGRAAIGTAPWDPTPRTTSRRGAWLRFDETPRRPDGTVDSFSDIVLCDTMPGSVGEKVGPTDRLWFSPSVDLTVHLLAERRSDWVLAVGTARWAGDGYASVDQALWDMGDDGAAEPVLVAYATQICFFTFLD